MTEPTSPDVSAIAAAGGIAVQPIGATEQHGPHLPLATDALIATALARAAADTVATRAAAGEEGMPALWVLPTLAYGKSPEHSGFAGTVTLSSTTMLAICRDLARSVADAGIRTLVFVNAHGGNPEVLHLAERDIRDDTGLLAVTVHAPSLPLPDALVAQMTRPDLDIHAGFYETSVLLAFDPGLVRGECAQADGIERIDDLAAHAASPMVGLFGAVPLPWRTRDVSESGVIGDPSGASSDWGRAALAAQGDVLADILVEIARLRPELE